MKRKPGLKSPKTNNYASESLSVIRSVKPISYSKYKQPAQVAKHKRSLTGAQNYQSHACLSKEKLTSKWSPGKAERVSATARISMLMSEPKSGPLTTRIENETPSCFEGDTFSKASPVKSFAPESRPSHLQLSLPMTPCEKENFSSSTTGDDAVSLLHQRHARDRQSLMDGFQQLRVQAKETIEFCTKLT